MQLWCLVVDLQISTTVLSWRSWFSYLSVKPGGTMGQLLLRTCESSLCATDDVWLAKYKVLMQEHPISESLLSYPNHLCHVWKDRVYPHHVGQNLRKTVKKIPYQERNEQKHLIIVQRGSQFYQRGEAEYFQKQVKIWSINVTGSCSY